jgi:hypothetical protein
MSIKERKFENANKLLMAVQDSELLNFAGPTALHSDFVDAVARPELSVQYPVAPAEPIYDLRELSSEVTEMMSGKDDLHNLMDSRVGARYYRRMGHSTGEFYPTSLVVADHVGYSSLRRIVQGSNTPDLLDTLERLPMIQAQGILIRTIVRIFPSHEIAEAQYDLPENTSIRVPHKTARQDYRNRRNC